MSTSSTLPAPATLDPPAPDARPALQVVPRRRPWRWVGTALVVVLLAQLVNGLVTNPAWEWSTVGDYLFTTTILRALLTTIQLTVLGTVLGFALGVVLAAMRLSGSAFLQGVAWTYVWAFRSIPLIVQLLFWFNIAYLYKQLSIGVPFGPELFTFSTSNVIGAMGAAVLGLALHQAAYAAEIIRGGIASVDPGQLEAAAALGIPRRRQFFKIVLPQAMRSILPNATNEVISLFKGTSIVSVLAIPELFYQVQVIYGRTSRVVPLLIVATIWYVVLTTALSIGQYYLERHYAKGSTRVVPPTPLQRLRSRISACRTDAAAARGEVTR
ncbi:amino acid ABC transporter permease [Luteipulveratus halotolerans]|uniref:Amino acid ABC transporter permease n=1 Tax=Luteipulveratus halotolerans TaxID=1631356 RepID=A0A0L6CK36_9MICO|nr:amino acid ABC transporter permease [Luteipulveratus halotolerans]KNX37960.1 amino acid ABC transporter permease [Luteipulveratus halotolerans]